MYGRKKYLLFAFIISLVTMVSILLIPATYASSDGSKSEEFQVRTGDFDEYTDSINLYDVNTGMEISGKKIVDYPAYVQTTYHLIQRDQEIPKDEWILKIVPKEVFQNSGRYFYMGKTYGFFIDYKKDDNSYFVYLIYNSLKVDLPDGQIQVTLKPFYNKPYFYRRGKYGLRRQRCKSRQCQRDRRGR